MNKLDNLVEEFVKQHKEDLAVVSALEIKQDDLIAEQEEKIRQTAKGLIPVMELIASKGYRFKGKDTDYMTTRGPILKHDARKNILYVFSIKRKQPITVDLHDSEVKLITYRNLLVEIDFSTIMDSLLMTLEFNQEIKDIYEKNIARLEAELRKYNDV